MRGRIARRLVLLFSLTLIGNPLRAIAQPSPSAVASQALAVELVGQIGGAVKAVAVRGGYAYIGVGPRLVILDISNPAQPAVIGQTAVLPGVVADVAVAGSYAYVADREGGLRIVDVSDPAAPREVGFYDTPGYAGDVAVVGSYAYVADGEGGLVILRFTGGPTYRISGRVVDPSGNPIPGVTISDNAGHTTTTGSDGRYTLSGLAAGTYTVTPSKSGYTFFPASRTVTVPPDATGVDFTGAPGLSPTPSGSLTLIASPVVAVLQPVAATAVVRNTGSSAQQFTLTFRLWQGDTLLATQTFSPTLAAGATAEQRADFGLRPAGQYRIEAILSAGTMVLAIQSRTTLVASIAVARMILDYAEDLRRAAHSELDDIAHIPSSALADEILDSGLDRLEDYAVGKFADLAAPIQDAGGIPHSTSDDALAAIRDKLGRARQYRRELSIAVRRSVRELYGVTLPSDFDPVNPDLDFITDPILKSRIKNWLARYLAS
ncbi:MAG: carboxypeptidase regulatory-like domain-containing protein, partial [Thermoflexus sp.]